MGWFSDDSNQAQAYDQVKSDNQASLSHELIAGAASYEAMKAYEKHVAENGEPPSHEKAKELLAAFTGAFIDREVETRGMDQFDTEKAKHAARQQAEQGLRDDPNNNFN
ncbi:putative phosphoglycerate mutase family protein [Venturia nashicola]|uniref:Putative phosphoglycerate mutase family protein n=1 Tax=Venturia nashicola TaxID=86259 RepID=A0A4Z1P1U2_9PEZI|nr:putative phosphoglycerate mutase family protein [Venturia nashicola]TLD35507.1 putative phosphoglycerate mutase family protein [Venturia nashicola]